MHFKTKRLYVRPFEAGDLEETFLIYKDERTVRYLLHGVWTQENKNEAFQAKLKNNELTQKTKLNLAVTLDSRVIGDMSVWYTGIVRSVEIGYCFLREACGKGYATEAVYALVCRLFRMYRMHRIQANLDTENTSSAKLLERIGMRREGHFIKDYWNKGKWIDSFHYAMLKEDFDKINSVECQGLGYKSTIEDN